MHTHSRACFATISLVVALISSSISADEAPTPKLGAATSAQPEANKTIGSPPKKTPADTAQKTKPAGASESDPGVSKTTAADKKGSTPPEYKPRRWSLTSGGSQRKDWLTGKDRFDWPSEYNAKKTLGLPSWLNASLEYRVRYETMDVPFVKGQTGGQHQIPMQTVLWMEANYESFRAGFEFWDARQYGAQHSDYIVNNTMVDVADFPQMYAAWSTQNLLDSELGFEAKGGRMTMDLGSRRLVARNAFRNTTNSFTGVSFRLRDGAGDWQVQAFANQPVVRLPDQQSQLVNNGYAWDEEQTGAFFTGGFAETNQLPWDSRGELYLYYLGEDQRSSNHRRLFTPGFRVYRQPKKGEWDFEGESIAQTGNRLDTVYDPATGKGTKTELSTEAFYEHIQLGYTFDLPWDPRILVQYDYATGGLNGSKTVTNSFDTLYGARRWEYGPTGIFGPFARNNINSPGTRVFIVPHRDVAAFVAYRAWWMADSKAPWQQAQGISLVDPTGKAGDFLGHTVELSARWDAHENIAFEGGWAYLIKGNFARNAPGAPTNHDNVNYFYVQTQLRF